MPNPEDKLLEKQLTDEILDRVAQIARLRTKPEEFVPGKTPVKYAGRVYDEREMVALTQSAIEFWLTGGRWHRRLEDHLAKWYGLPHALLVNSGSSANLLATAALMSPLLGERRLVPGDEVVTVAAGFPTTVAASIQLGLVPVFVDISKPTFNIDVDLLEQARSNRTKAVMVAHTLGNPFDLAAVKRFCDAHELWMVEDNCDAAGSLYEGRKTGTFGDIATLSFYPPHHMTTGEGGAVLCSDDLLAKALESLRDWGRDCYCQPGVDNTCGKRFGWQLGDLPFGYDHKYTYTHLGFNLKMTDMQAAVGVMQLEKLDGFGAARRDNWRFYRDAMKDLEEFFYLPEPTENSDPSWFGFLLTVREDAPFQRDRVVAHLESKKIQTRMLFGGNLVRQPALTTLAANEGRPVPFRVAGPLTTTDLVMTNSFWVGVYPGLTRAMREFVADELHTVTRKFAATAEPIALPRT
jgi:CDP-6-deoxy-D-xylo-4-hexulose-3-dehydrase